MSSNLSVGAPTITIDGEPWFALADLCAVLGLRQFRTDRLADDVIRNHPILDTLGRRQSTTIVNESGMYEVVIRSDKPEAVAFRRLGILQGNNLPYQRYAHHFEVKLGTRQHPKTGETIPTTRTYVKPSALPFLRKKLHGVDEPVQLELNGAQA